MRGPAVPGPPAGPGTPSAVPGRAGTPLRCCWPGNSNEGAVYITSMSLSSRVDAIEYTQQYINDHW